MIRISISLVSRLFSFSSLLRRAWSDSMCSSDSVMRTVYLRRISSTSSVRAIHSASYFDLNVPASPFALTS
uniref:Putative secreted protein n=1 Tax=Anopheles marajoara TaxID=58244 RepID=A0A2M4CEM5_9DIPT